MTVHKRAMLVDLARVELAKRPTEHDADPKRYEPPEWLLAALEAAYDAGARDDRERWRDPTPPRAA